MLISTTWKVYRLPNLFDAVVQMMVSAEDVERCELGRRAAVEAIQKVADIREPRSIRSSLWRAKPTLLKAGYKGCEITKNTFTVIPTESTKSGEVSRSSRRTLI